MDAKLNKESVARLLEIYREGGVEAFSMQSPRVAELRSMGEALAATGGSALLKEVWYGLAGDNCEREEYPAACKLEHRWNGIAGWYS